MNHLVPAITAAIRERRVIHLRYDGWVAERAIEPHAVGLSSASNEVLSAWQEFGASESGERSGWKLFTLSKIVSMRVSDERFSSARPGYTRDSKTMPTIYAQL